MSRRESSKSGLFLMELIILILFFSIAGAICVRLFVSAHTRAADSANLNKAVLAAQSAVEAYKGSGQPGETFQELLGAKADADGVYQVYYDEAWQAAETEAPAFVMVIRISEESGVGQADVSIVQQGRLENPIYTLTAKKLLP